MSLHPFRWAAVAGAAAIFTAPALGAGTEGFTAGRFLVTVAGESPELVDSVEGGDQIGFLQKSGPQVDGTFNLSLGEFPSQQNLAIRFTPARGAGGLEKWLAAGLAPAYTPRNGAITNVSATGDAVSERSFEDAGILEVVFPRLDAQSEEPVSIHLLAEPATSAYTLLADGSPVPLPKVSKRLLAKHFRLSVDGLDTSGVVTIESISVSQIFSQHQVSNLVVSLAASTAEDWFTWFEDFVIQGNHGPSEERAARIEYLSADTKAVLGTVRLHNVGILSLRAERADGWVTKKSAKRASGRVVAELYVERLAYEP